MPSTLVEKSALDMLDHITDISDNVARVSWKEAEDESPSPPLILMVTQNKTLGRVLIKALSKF